MRRERGLALVVVLWGIAALSLIVFAMLASSRNAARISHNAWSQVQVQAAADAAVQGALLALFDPDPAGQPPLDGTPRASDAGDIALRVAVQDESGRIDLDAASRNLLRDYFKAAGADDAEALADRVVDWRAPKGESHDDGARARHGPFQSVDELALVPGVSPALFARLAPGLTVYTHNADFDLRLAPPLVLATIPGMQNQDAAVAAAARKGIAARAGHAYTIVASAARGPVRAVRRATVLLTGDPARPCWVLDWR